MRLYLDACCWNRPFDDQSQPRVHLESVAVLAISKEAEQKQLVLLSSDVLEFELARTPDPRRRAGAQALLLAAQERIVLGPDERIYARHLSETYGLRAFDALHLACAQTLRADAFLTTDDRLLRACYRMADGERVFVVANPLAWLTDFLEHG